MRVVGEWAPADTVARPVGRGEAGAAPKHRRLLLGIELREGRHRVGNAAVVAVVVAGRGRTTGRVVPGSNADADVNACLRSTGARDRSGNKNRRQCQRSHALHEASPREVSNTVYRIIQELSSVP
jgi:hypothetical protein